MTEEQLIALGYTKEQAVGIIALHKESTNELQEKCDQLERQITDKEKQIKERDEQISQLKTFEGTNEELQENIKKLEESNNAQEQKYLEKMKEEQKKTAVKLYLLSSKEGRPHDVDLVTGLFDMDKIEIDDKGEIVKGLEEQEASLRKDRGFLFEGMKGKEDDPFPWIPIGTLPPDSNDSTVPKDAAESYGHSLAQEKLNALGISIQENK